MTEDDVLMIFIGVLMDLETEEAIDAAKLRKQHILNEMAEDAQLLRQLKGKKTYES